MIFFEPISTRLRPYSPWLEVSPGQPVAIPPPPSQDTGGVPAAGQDIAARLAALETENEALRRRLEAVEHTASAANDQARYAIRKMDAAALGFAEVRS